jgi:hypothetical protein
LKVIFATMTKLGAAADIGDPHVLLSGDMIGFQVDTLGLLCTPSTHEPIPEKEELVSHLRICTSQKKPSTADYRRCMFTIENDSGQVLPTALNSGSRDSFSFFMPQLTF